MYVCEFTDGINIVHLFSKTCLLVILYTKASKDPKDLFKTIKNVSSKINGFKFRFL